MGVQNPKLQKAIDDIRRNPGLYSCGEVAKKHGLEYNQVSGGIKRYKDVYQLVLKREPSGPRPTNTIQLLNRVERKRDTRNVMIIGDTHEPFTLDGYLDFCKWVHKTYKITHVVHIGDLIDNAFTSYHEIDPDGMAAGRELEKAIERIELWDKAFPIMDVCVGNHDRLAYRKAFSSGISSRWIRNYSDVLNTPGWEFREQFIYDDIRYIHGEQGTAKARARKDLISTVQGHRHSEAYVEHIVGENFRIFGMQVGCGIDRRSYAMHYAKAGNKPAIGVGVVLDHGKQPINVLAELKGGIITNA